MAQALGLTLEDLQAKRRAYLELHQGAQLKDDAAIKKGLRRGEFQQPAPNAQAQNGQAQD